MPTPTVPNDLTSGSRRASFGAIHMPYRQRQGRAHNHEGGIGEEPPADGMRRRLAEAPAEQRPGDVGAHRTDRTERQIDNTGGPVQDD